MYRTNNTIYIWTTDYQHHTGSLIDIPSLQKNHQHLVTLDNGDKRVSQIFLTPKGVERRKIAKATVLDFNDKLIKLVSKEDYEAFARVSKMIEQLSDEILKETQNKKQPNKTQTQ